jgi:hypothetical protein
MVLGRASFLPHSLTNEQQEHRLRTCKDFLQACHTNPHFLICIVIGDTGVSIQSSSRTSGSGLEYSIVTQAQNVLFAKVKDQNDVCQLNAVCDLQGFVPEEKT